MSLPTFTLFHVVLSLIGILAGFLAVAGLLRSTLEPRWTALFLFMTVLTCVTGFFFPFTGGHPLHIVGVISLVVMVGLGIAALRAFRPAMASGRLQTR
jgi:hypothetical protein